MTADLKTALASCREALARIETRLDEEEELPALPAAKTLVALAAFTSKVDRLRADLDGTNGSPAKPRRRKARGQE
jgi:hypothetical protein